MLKLNPKRIIAIAAIMMLLFTPFIIAQSEDNAIGAMLRNIITGIRDLRSDLVNRECTDFVNLGIPTPMPGSTYPFQVFTLVPESSRYKELTIEELRGYILCISVNPNLQNVCNYNLNGHLCASVTTPPGYTNAITELIDLASCIPYLHEGANYHNTTSLLPHGTGNGWIQNYYAKLKITRNC